MKMYTFWVENQVRTEKYVWQNVTTIQGNAFISPSRFCSLKMLRYGLR